MKTLKQDFKSFVYIFMALSFIPSINIYSQASYNPYVEYIISNADLDSISQYTRELSGDTMATIGGMPFLIYSRYAYSPANEKAAQYIFEKFQSFGLKARYQVYSPTGKNVIAVLPGTKFPGKQYLICAHYDAITFNMEDTIHGADDNATGTCAVLEAARVLSRYTFEYTLIFAALDEEEIGLYGSGNYADSAYFNGDSLLGVINLDMIAFDSDNDNAMQVGSDSSCPWFADILLSSSLVYQPQLDASMDYQRYGSDQLSFLERGFTASVFHESTKDFNRYTHTILDNYANLKTPYMLGIIKSAIASLVVIEKDFIININHIPLSNTFDTSGRDVAAVIKSNHPIAGLSNQPRLYYKTQAAQLNYVNAYYHNLDTFKFTIPGFPGGSTVFYYIAAQDSASTLVGSSPAGCRGINPPGNVPPKKLFSYYVLSSFSICSQNLPKALPPRTIVFDSIYVDMTKLIQDINISVTINHSNDTDLYVMLNRSGFNQTNMSIRNGGSGDNYINTVLDDEADTLIKNGTPPFTGNYRPEALLDKFDNSPTAGYWVLKILNNSDSIAGELVEWCVNISYYDPISIGNIHTPVKFSLSQNYPNPFNASTKISYEIPEQGIVKLVIYDILGREVLVLVNSFHNPGKYEAVWNADDYSSGIYFYRLIYKDFVMNKKMVLIK